MTYVTERLQTATQVAITAPGTVEVLPDPEQERELRPRESRLRIQRSGVSAGTEDTFFQGTNPNINLRWNADLRIYERNPFAQDEGSGTIVYPPQGFNGGYMETGEVIETQSELLQVGDVISLPAGHRSQVIIPEDRPWIKLPPGMDPDVGVFPGHVGPICANNILFAASTAAGMGPEIPSLEECLGGKRVAIIGGGMIGLVTAMFLKRANPADSVIIELMPERIKAIEKMGFNAMQSGPDVHKRLKEYWRMQDPLQTGADVTINCAPSDRALQQAFAMVRFGGIVIDASFHQGGMPNLRLGEEAHLNQPLYRVSQISHTPREQWVYGWSRLRLQQEGLGVFIENASLIRDHLITDRREFSEAHLVFKSIASRDPHTIVGVLRPNEV